MKKASEQKISWAKIELIDILWLINAPEADYELFIIASDAASLGDTGAMIRLARCF